MELNEQQKLAVAEWFAAGESLDAIQKRIGAEFGVHMTYFDLRMMVADLPQPKEPDPVVEEKKEQDVPEMAAEPAAGADDALPAAADGAAGDGAASTLSVTVDALMIPGTLASGDVVFSDGQKGKWYLDRQGRLGLGGELPPGYRPPPADAALFQSRLMEELQKKGLC